MFTKKTKRIFAIASMLCTFGLIGATSYNTYMNVSADTAGGGSSGGSGGRGDWGYRSYKLNGKESSSHPSKAWNEFYKKDAVPGAHVAKLTHPNSKASIEKWIKDHTWPGSSSANKTKQLNVCKTSSTIYYYTDSSHKPWYSQSGDHVVVYGQKGSFKNFPHRTDMENWMKKQKGHSAKSSKPYNKHDSGWTLICSGGMGFDSNYVKTYTKTEKQTGSKNLKVSFTGVYDSQTTLAPERTTGYGKYSKTNKAIWDKTHETQNSAVKKNGWSNWVDSLGKINIAAGSKDGQSKLDDLKNQSKNHQKGDYVAHPTVKMSAKNRKGFAKGGVFTVTELRRNATVTYTGSQSKERSRKLKCTQVYQNNKKVGKPVCKPTTSKNNGWSAWKYHKATVKNNAKKTSRLPYQYWQMINVRCNANGLDNVRKNISGFVEDSYGSGNGSSSGHTKVYKYAGNGKTAYVNRPLGNANQSNKILKATATDKFYESTGSCDGHSDGYTPKNPNDPNSPATNWALDCSSALQKTATNASNANVQNTGKMFNGKYGAQAKQENKGTISSDAFSFYRNNKEQTLRTDLWYPTVHDSKSGVTSSKDNALWTRMVFDPSGTPTGDTFGLRISAGGKDVINGKGGNAGQNYKSSSEITKVYPHASWVSSKTHPQKMNIDWTWTPTVTNNVYPVVSGNGANANPNKSTDKSEIMATCAIRMNTNKAINENLTVQNSLFENSLGNLTKFDNAKNHYASMSFVRATADAQ